MTEHTNPGGRFPHVLRAVMETPWALEPAVLAAIREGHYDLARIAGPAPTGRRTGTVAVLPLQGVITPKADMFTDLLGGTAADRFRASFLDAVDDRDVSAIVLDVSSPGGMTDQMPELAADIRAARGRKPVVAVANAKAASAAYWLASQADEIIVTPSGSVGSIGVYAAHEDLSGALEQAGIKTTLVSAGRFKTEANPFEPLSDEARAAIQERVDELYSMFTSDVAKGRRVPVETVRGGFGEGRMLTAKQAVKQGLADSVATLQQTVDRFAAQPVGRRGMAVASTVVLDGAALAQAVTSTTGDHFTIVTNPPGEPADTEASEAAASGLSFAAEAENATAALEALTARLTSLAEVKRGDLTVAKREQVAACRDRASAAVAALNEALQATDPDKHRESLIRQYARTVAEDLRRH